MDKYTPNFMTAPPELTARGIDFLTKVSTSAEKTPTLEGDESVAENFMTQGAMKDGPTYGVMMFRKPRMAEMDQGYTLEDYFLTSPTAVESPFSHRDPTEVGLMTQDQPSSAIKRSEVVDEPVLYGDLNSLLNKVSSGLAAAAEPVTRHARQAWDGLSDENKKRLKVAGVAATVLGGAGLTNRYLNSKAGRTMVISRALRAGGGNPVLGNPVDEALVASAYGDADDPEGWSSMMSQLAADQSEDLTTQAMLLGAEGSDSVLNPESRMVAQIPVDFFRTAYALGKTYQEAKSEPTFAYSFLDGDPLTTALGLKYLKAPACYIDQEGRMFRTATPYSAPFFMAGGALWDKIKNGIKKIGGKLIDGARKFVNSGIGSALTSIIPWGGAVKTAVNAVGKVKDFIGNLRGKKEEQAAEQPVTVAAAEAPATEQLVVASDNPTAVPLAVAANNIGAAPQGNLLVAPPASTVDDAAAAAANANRVEAAKQLIAAAGVTPIDELEGSKSAVDSLPTSWRVAPQQGALGYSLSDRVAAITQASSVGAGDPLQGFIPALVAYPVLDFLLGAVAQGAAFYGVEKAGDGLLSLIKKKRSQKEELPVENASAGDVTSSMALLQDWLSKSALISARQGSPMSGSVGSAMAKLIGKGVSAAARGVSTVSPYVKKGAKVIASKLGSAGKVFLRALKKKPVFTVIGSCGAVFVASSMLNRKPDQRRAIVAGVRQTLENLSASGYAEVTDQMMDFVNKYENILIDSPDQLDQSAKATWEAILQYCYLSLLSLDSDRLTPDQRDLCERCQKAGEEMRSADPEAYAVFSNMVGHTIAASTGVDPDDEAIAQSVGDADSIPAESKEPSDDVSESEAASDASSLLSNLGLGAAAPAALRAAEDVAPVTAQEVASSVASGAAGEDAAEAAEAEAAQGQALTPEQEDAVEQAASIMAVPTSSLEDEQRMETSAAQVLARAGIAGASAALILSLIRRKRAEQAGDSGEGLLRSAWSAVFAPGRSNRDSVRFKY